MFGLNKIKDSLENVKVKMDRVYTDTMCMIDVNCGKLGLDGKTVMKTAAITSTVIAGAKIAKTTEVVRDVKESYQSAKAFEDTSHLANSWAKLAMEDATNKKIVKDAAKYTAIAYTTNKLSK